MNVYNDGLTIIRIFGERIIVSKRDKQAATSAFIIGLMLLVAFTLLIPIQTTYAFTNALTRQDPFRTTAGITTVTAGAGAAAGNLGVVWLACQVPAAFFGGLQQPAFTSVTDNANSVWSIKNGYAWTSNFLGNSATVVTITLTAPFGGTDTCQGHLAFFDTDATAYSSSSFGATTFDTTYNGLNGVSCTPAGAPNNPSGKACIKPLNAGVNLNIAGTTPPTHNLVIAWSAMNATGISAGWTNSETVSASASLNVIGSLSSCTGGIGVCPVITSSGYVYSTSAATFGYVFTTSSSGATRWILSSGQIIFASTGVQNITTCANSGTNCTGGSTVQTTGNCSGGACGGLLTGNNNTFLYVAQSGTAGLTITNITTRVLSYTNAGAGKGTDILSIGVYQTCAGTACQDKSVNVGPGNPLILLQSFNFNVGTGTNNKTISFNPSVAVNPNVNYAVTIASKFSGVSILSSPAASAATMYVDTAEGNTPSKITTYSISTPSLWLFWFYAIPTVTSLVSSTFTTTLTGVATTTSTITSNLYVNQTTPENAAFWFIPLIFILVPTGLFSAIAIMMRRGR